MRMNRGWETIAWASTTICCSPPDSVRACASRRLSQLGEQLERLRDARAALGLAAAM